ncbi:hypothetical protein GP486_007384 [Trichoglossum hirsutum]|uniref:NGG1p interacting factor 3 n=1 Tax=Trichoglossum hirsutum TaxID=265104 RepID=A0A9P8ICU7_9PEZI|nr:hypothetical protein GP486_007384 [Trichoglossum hirsutum]
MRQDQKQNNSVLLTLDLTRAVVDEAIKRKDSVIVAYHPIIFRGLKDITLGDSQQESMLRLIQEGISVYSPHTAVDAVTGGIGDWMVDIVTSPFKDRPGFDFKTDVLCPSEIAVDGFRDAGIGRTVEFSQTVNLAELLEAIGKRLGLEYLQLALPHHLRTVPHASISLSSIAMCAGSGGPIIIPSFVDVLFTGELTHHNALAAIEKGQIVIATFHSNSERGFLKEILWQKLKDGLKKEWGEEVDVGISEVDSDPYEIIKAPKGGSY